MSTREKKLTLLFKEIDKHDIPLVGGKGANLGEMTHAGFPVPEGFAVTVEAYEQFLVQNNLHKFVSDTLSAVDVSISSQLDMASRTIQKRVISGVIPDEVKREVIKSYSKLSGLFSRVLVAVRSSATAEDLPNASFAGQQSTYLNIHGESNLLTSIRECWASLFTPRAIFYRVENKIDHSKVKISVIVQKMVQSVVSGVMFTVNPVTQEKDRIIIESVWGLGEMIVQGSVVPDKYVVQKETFSVLSKEVSNQAVQLIRVGENTKETQVPVKIRDLQKIPDEIVVKLAKLGQKLQDHYYFPQDVEWAWDKKNVYIVQTRPVTTLTKKGKEKFETKDESVKIANAPILTGVSASPGVGTGPVKIVAGPKEISKVEPGDVLVAKMTSPDYVPAMKKAVAIVTDEGGLTSHAAIVSRELGIPCVVGTKIATTKLGDGMIISVDGLLGHIFMGANIKRELTKVKTDNLGRKHTKVKTATKVYVNLGEPEMAENISKENVDGVGLLRAEFMIANIGIHPRQAIKDKTQDKFVNKLADKIITFCESFGDRPVVYRATDFKTNEYRQLEGGKAWEPEEPNPLMGFRGAFRYISNPEVFNLELAAIKKVRAKHNNLWLMIPFVRSPEELMKVRRLVATEGLFESPSFKFWMMVELPVNVILLEDFIKVGIDGVSIGSNDLTMLILGTDRDNAEVAQAFNERSPSVSWAIKRVVKTCLKHGVTVSICGQAPSTYDDLVEDLVIWGATSVSVNPDAIDRVREVIHNAERKLISNG